ncbi:MAG TPA: hypothetical protein VMB85_06165 [Bryobacteraceae bacterium]|nr:hypothetical protein [Bryobacteraceae bacterium]
MTIHISDEVVPGGRLELRVVTIPQAGTTPRELIRCRIREEVGRHNESPAEVFHGLVQPEESERILNGFRMHARRSLSWEVQFERACSSFLRNGFLLIVNGRQVADLDEPIELHSESEVQFVKLVPLVGG